MPRLSFKRAGGELCRRPPTGALNDEAQTVVLPHRGAYATSVFDCRGDIFRQLADMQLLARFLNRPAAEGESRPSGSGDRIGYRRSITTA